MKKLKEQVPNLLLVILVFVQCVLFAAHWWDIVTIASAAVILSTTAYADGLNNGVRIARSVWRKGG